VDRARLLQLRLFNQRLVATAFTTPRQVVSWLGGVQAQDYPAAKWAVGQRTIGGTDALVEQAFDAGEILRTHVLRPTWHFVAPEDIRWMLALTGPRLKASMRAPHVELELDDRVLRRTNMALAKALDGGDAMTRAELQAVLARARVSARGRRLIHILAWAEFDGVICSGPRRDRQFTYMLLDKRATGPAIGNRDEALARLADRYFSSRGPATLRDYMWWSGLTAGDARRGVDAAASSLGLEQVSIDDTTCWWRPPSGPAARSKGHGRAIAHLLPVYDEFFVAYRDRRAALPDNGARSGSTFHQNPIFYPTVVVNGRVASGWTRTAAKGSTVATIGPPAVSKMIRPAVAAAAERYAKFLGTPVAIVWKAQ
jgi:hypothetical protein